MKTMFNLKYCPVCGSDFIVHDPDDWTYKMRDARHIMRYYCSYKCFRRAGDEKNCQQEGMTFKLNHPLTEEQWDAITDVDMEHTPMIEFHTKNGKIVKYRKVEEE